MDSWEQSGQECHPCARTKLLPMFPVAHPPAVVTHGSIESPDSLDSPYGIISTYHATRESTRK